MLLQRTCKSHNDDNMFAHLQKTQHKRKRAHMANNLDAVVVVGGCWLLLLLLVVDGGWCLWSLWLLVVGTGTGAGVGAGVGVVVRLLLFAVAVVVVAAAVVVVVVVAVALCCVAGSCSAEPRALCLVWKSTKNQHHHNSHPPPPQQQQQQDYQQQQQQRFVRMQREEDYRDSVKLFLALRVTDLRWL